MAIADLIKDKSKEEKAQIKAKEIAKVRSVPKTKRSKYDIEITDINVIDGGIEVFARAWEQGKQIGFGKDGSVDIERFIIKNPPILIDDPAGDIKRPYKDIYGNNKELSYREDPLGALLNCLEHTISVKKEKFGPENIIQNKVGSTTSTFYPDADPESTSVDGDVFHSLGVGSGVSWASLVGAAGNGSSDSATAGNVFIRSDTGSGNWRQMFRFVTLFDTSSIPDTDTISSATISYWGNVVDADTFSLTLNVSEIGPASNTSLTSSDYATISSTKLATGVGWGSLTAGAYNDLSFNASGIAAISKTGVSKFVARNENDIDVSSPTWTSSAAQNFEVRTADTTGTTNDPKLVVEHGSAAVAIPSSNLALLGVG